MANYQVLKNAIQQVIKPNGNEEITGQIMQQALIAMINALGKGYQFIGVVEPDTEFTPGDEKIVAVGFTPGMYEDFGGVELVENHIGIFMWDGEWHIFTKEIQGVFTAVYDETSIQELKKAVRSGKKVWCSISVDIEDDPHPFMLPLIEPNPDSERFVFSGIIDIDTYLYVECFDGHWDYYKSSMAPDAYLKSASVANNTLTLTPKEGMPIVFSPEKDTLIITTETPASEWLPYVGQKNIILKDTYNHDFFGNSPVYLPLVLVGNNGPFGFVYHFSMIFENTRIERRYSTDSGWGNIFINDVTKLPYEFLGVETPQEINSIWLDNQPIIEGTYGAMALSYDNTNKVITFLNDTNIILYKYEYDEEFSRNLWHSYSIPMAKLSDLASKEDTSNKETTLTPTSTEKYPSSKAVADYVEQRLSQLGLI